MVSIIIPVYNVGKYLNQCVESALKLKTDCEIILVDDGSKDHSGKLCDLWAEKSVKVRVIHQENGGLSAARNAGIRVCKGEYVLFMDADDFLYAEETDSMLKAMETGVDCILGLYQKYYEQRELYEKEKCDAFLQYSGLIDINTFLKCVPLDGTSCYMVAYRFIVRREILLQHDLLFMPGIYHEDEEWTHRLLCSIDNIYMTNKFFYQYRQAREGSIMSTVKPKNISDRFIIMEKLRRLLQRADLNTEKKQYLRYRMAQLYLNNMIDSRILDKADKRQTYEKLAGYTKECVNYLCGRTGSIVGICVPRLGVPKTCFLLSIARKIIKG